MQRRFPSASHGPLRSLTATAKFRLSTAPIVLRLRSRRDGSPGRSSVVSVGRQGSAAGVSAQAATGALRWGSLASGDGGSIARWADTKKGLPPTAQGKRGGKEFLINNFASTNQRLIASICKNRAKTPKNCFVRQRLIASICKNHAWTFTYWK